MFRIVLISLCLFSLSCAHQKSTESVAKLKLNFKVTRFKLDNGLTVLMVPRTKLPIFFLQTYYKVGSKYEYPGITGASHFLEHMMFKGAKKYGPGKFDQLVEGNGGTNNAYTTQDQTVYHEALPKEHLEKIIDLEADRMNNLLLEKKSFESERQVVLEERKMRYENSDYGKMQSSMMEKMYEGSAYGTTVIGDIPDLKTVSRDQIQKYFKQYYAPNNAVMVIVGDIDIEQTKKWIKKYFGSLKASHHLEQEKKKVLKERGLNFAKNFPKVEHIPGSAPNPIFWLGYQGEKMGTRKSYALDMLSSMLGDGESSYLMKKLVLTRDPMMSKIGAYNYTLEDSGAFLVMGSMLKAEGFDENIKKLRSIMREACDHEITDKKLDVVKKQYIVSSYRSLDTNDGISAFLGNRESTMGNWEDYKKEFEIYDSIDADEVKKVCHEYIDDAKTVLVSSGKKE